MSRPPTVVQWLAQLPLPDRHDAIRYLDARSEEIYQLRVAVRKLRKACNHALTCHITEDSRLTAELREVLNTTDDPTASQEAAQATSSQVPGADIKQENP